MLTLYRVTVINKSGQVLNVVYVVCPCNADYYNLYNVLIYPFIVSISLCARAECLPQKGPSFMPSSRW